MNDIQIAVGFFCFSALIVAGLQVGLTLGAPWGEWAMGGRVRGRFPVHLRIGAWIQLLIVLASVLVALTRAGLILPSWYSLSRVLIWFVTVLFAVSTVLNLITPSKKERLLGAPTVISLFLSSLYLAMH